MERGDARIYADMVGDMETGDTDISVTTNRPSGSYVGEVYIPVPYLFNNLEYTTDEVFFGQAISFNNDQLGNGGVDSFVRKCRVVT